MAFKIAVTGFVEAQGGSVASANAIILRRLLDRGVEVHFFSKPSFVDPRPVVGNRPNFHFHDSTNANPDQMRRRLRPFPVLRQFSEQWDSSSYEKLLVRRITEVHRTENFAFCLWLGTYAPARVAGLRAISFAQGPPGTDARSFLDHQAEIAALAGAQTARKWATLARIRLSRWGLPKFAASDHIIVGSEQSVRTLRDLYNIEDTKISACPYPIDLDAFHLRAPFAQITPNEEGLELRVLWLGRIVPRKRLDVFLNGSALAIERGVPLRLTIVGGMAMIPEYEKLIKGFPFPERLLRIPTLPRSQIPALLWNHDVLAQPSDEENFGSSVAEAQACGLPAIVGYTNGNADYLCPASIHLGDDKSETFAAALETMFCRKQQGMLASPEVSRHTAEKFFAPDVVVDRFMAILEKFNQANS